MSSVFADTMALEYSLEVDGRPVPASGDPLYMTSWVYPDGTDGSEHQIDFGA